MQRVRSEPNVLNKLGASDRPWRCNGESASSTEEHRDRPRLPGSARSEYPQGRGSTQGEDLLALRWSGDGSTVSSKQLACDSSEGIGSLMPIIQRSAISPAAPTSLKRLTHTEANTQSLTPSEPAFRRRIGTQKSPSSHRRAHARVAQLMAEPVQEDSPKGINRALTPSMLKAVKRSDRGEGRVAEAIVAPKSSGGLSVFQSSFSRQTAREEMEESYDSLVVPFRSSLDGPNKSKAPKPSEQRQPSPRRSSRTGNTEALPSARWQTEISADISRQEQTGSSAAEKHHAEGIADLRSLEQHVEVSFTDPAQPLSEEEGLAADGAGNSEQVETRESDGNDAIFLDDHVQLLARRKALNISTTRQKDNDQARKLNVISDSSSSYPLMQTTKPIKFIRSNITRVSRRSLLGISKPVLFEMYNMKGRMKLCAERESGHSLSFGVFTPANGPEKKKLEASLVASSFVENQFLLIGTGPSSPIAACDPDQDPVIMAVSFTKGPSGQRIVTALPPDNKLSTAGDNDLGDKGHINDYFVRFEAGEPLQNVTVLQSVPGRELIGARITRGSVKNVQLQMIGSGQEWPGVTPKYPGSSLSSEKHGTGKAVFEFGRLRHNHEFVCDYESPLLSAVQAMGLAVACSAPKRAFLYI